jgi:hypothetical protein
LASEKEQDMSYGNTADPPQIAGLTRQYYDLSAGALNDFLVPSINVSNFRWFSLSIVGSSHVGQLSWQASQDDFASDPQDMYVYQLGLPSAYYKNATNVGSATQIFTGALQADYFRVIMNDYTSGSVTAVLSLYSNPSYPGTINAIQTGRWALGASVNSNQNGTTVFRLISAASNNATVIKNNSGQVYGYDIFNASGGILYVKLYNMNTTPAPATDDAHLVRTIGIEAGKSKVFHSTTGLKDFPDGIAMATVTGITDTNNSAVGTGDLAINIDYSLD